MRIFLLENMVNFLDKEKLSKLICEKIRMFSSWRGHSGTEGGGGGGGGGGAPALRISRKKGSFFRDFVKEGYFFVLRYEVWGSKSPYNPRNIRGSDVE